LVSVGQKWEFKPEMGHRKKHYVFTVVAVSDTIVTYTTTDGTSTNIKKLSHTALKTFKEALRLSSIVSKRVNLA
jgi:hypothetical protein